MHAHVVHGRCVERSVLLAVCGALLLCACGQGAETETLGLSEQAVIDGEPSPQAQNAVVAILNKQNEWATGVVVAPTLVLTALHFLFSATEPYHLQCASDRSGTPIVALLEPAGFSILYGNQKQLTPVARGVHVYHGADLDLCRNDIALLELDTPLTVTPLPLRLDAPAQRQEAGILIGWGQSAASEPPGIGLRRLQSAQTVLTVGPTLLALDDGGQLQVGNGTFVTGDGACFGDGGAPFISAATGAVVGVFSTLATLDPRAESQSFSFSECVGAHDVFRSVSAQSAWIREAFADTEQAPWLEGFAQPAATGKSCKVDAECISQRCAVAGGVGFCTVSCESAPCPGELQCVGAPGTQLCVPPRLASGATAQSCCMGISAPTRWATLLFTPLLFIWRRRRRSWSCNPLPPNENAK